MSNCLDCRGLQSGPILILDPQCPVGDQMPEFSSILAPCEGSGGLSSTLSFYAPSYTSQGSWIAQRKSTCTRNEHIWNVAFNPKTSWAVAGKTLQNPFVALFTGREQPHRKSVPSHPPLSLQIPPTQISKTPKA